MDTKALTKAIIETKEAIATQTAVQRGTNEKIDNALSVIHDHEIKIQQNKEDIHTISVARKTVNRIVAPLLVIVASLIGGIVGRYIGGLI